MRSRVWGVLAVLGLWGCSEQAGPRRDEGRLELELAALSLDGVGDVLWDVEVLNGLGETVWQRRVSSSRYGDGGGSASYVGTCDAGEGAADSSVRLWVVGVYRAAVTSEGTFASGATTGVTGEALRFYNPTEAGPLTQTVTCRENADVLVEFDVSLMRPAEQGFFDIAVAFNNIFCSAKFDCCEDLDDNGCAADGSEDLALLFDETGARADTVVLAFACTAGPLAEVETELYLDALQLDCTSPSGAAFSADIALDPSGPPGNQCVVGPNGMSSCAGVVSETTPTVDADDFLYQLAIYRGEEALESAGAPARKVYWNLALGVKRPAIGQCWLRTRGTADDAAGTPVVANGTIAPGVVYPYLEWEVDLASCGQEALTFGDPDAMVRTTYTEMGGEGTSFSYGFGPNRPVGGFCDPQCVNGGVCAGGACSCPVGFTGAACQTNLDECTPNPCLNGGVCVDGAGAYSCTCVGGYSGPTCEVAPADCGTTGAPCPTGEICTSFGVCVPEGTTQNGTPVSLSAATSTLALGESVTLVPSAGNAPYVFEIASGGGTLVGDVFTAPGVPGTTVVRVTDAFGTSDELTFTVYGPLAIAPATATVAAAGTLELSATGGVPPYVFNVAAGGGSVSGATFTAPSVGGSATVRVTDSLGHTDDAVVTITPPPSACDPNPCLNGGTCAEVVGGYECTCVGGYSGPTCATAPTAVVISPSSVQVDTNGAQTFSASGGVPPYVFSVVSGGGSFADAVYTAPGTAGSATVRVTDAIGQTDDATVTIVLPPDACQPVNPCQNGGSCSLAPGGYFCTCVNGYLGDDCELAPPCGVSGLPCPAGEFCAPGEVCVADGTTQNPIAPTIEPLTAELLVGESQVFTANDGNEPYTFSLTSGGGDLGNPGFGAPSPNTITYTAPTTPGMAVVRLVDAWGVVRDANVTVYGALGLSPAAAQVGQAVTLTGSGGLGPYTYQIVSGGGSLSGATYTAPGATGSVVIRMADALGHTKDTTLTIYPALAISPTTLNLQANGSTTFSATGGFGGYTYSVVSGGGAFSGAVYTAPSSAGTVTVRVSDALGNTSQATITVYAPLVISPSTYTMEVNQAVTLTATGGLGTRTFTKTSGGGTLSGATYTAPSTAGTAVIRVTDSIGNFRESTITITAAAGGVCTPNPCENGGACSLDPDDNTIFICECFGGWSGEICDVPPEPCGDTGAPCDLGYFCTDVGVCLPEGTTPNATPVAISPSAATILVNGTRTFTASHGNAPYVFSVVSGDGTMVDGVYTAPAWPGTAVVRVRDAFGVTADATVTIRPPLAISPSVTSVAVNGTVTFSATGGIGSYTYSKVSGGGSVSGATYTAPATTGTAVVRVSDSAGNTSDATVTISAFAISPTTANVQTDGTLTFTTTGGTQPYTYAVISGGGSMSGATYTAPSTPGSATVRVTSANGWTATATVTIFAPLTISPSSKLLMYGASQVFSASGGLGSYTYSKVDGAGTLSGATFTAASVEGTTTIRVTDGVGTTADAVVTTYPTLTLEPATSFVQSGEVVQLVASGGYGSYTFTIQSGGGTLVGSTYTATGAAGTSVIRVTDSLGNARTASVTIFGYAVVSAGGLSIVTNSTTPTAQTCGVRTDGTLWCWGSNASSQLGDGTTTARSWPVQVGTDTDWIDVAVGQLHACARKLDLSLWCWGNNGNGRLGDGTTTLRSTPVRIGTGNDWAAITAGNSHTCGVKNDGSLWCWGYNTPGQLGLGDTLQRTAPTRVGTLNTWATVSAGNLGSTCATRTDGTLWCWGEGAGYALGTGSTTDQTSPVQIGTATTWRNVTLGNSHGCGTRTDGTLWCWGTNASSRLGDGTTTNATTPKQIGTVTTWSAAAAGSEFTCGTRTDNTVWCWGNNTYGQVGDSTWTLRNVPTQVGTATSWGQVDVGPEHACATRQDGTLACWGYDKEGQLGISGTATKVRPVQVLGSWLATATSKGTHSCGVKSDGTMWCWGRANYSQLGESGTATRIYPIASTGGFTDWSQFPSALGIYYSCALRSSGAAYCWGRNTYGQLGDASTSTRTTPTAVSGGHVFATLTNGGNHTCGVRTDGTLWCWGYNYYGQVGDATATNRTSPKQISTIVTNWSKVANGTNHTCATRTDGTLWCWGRNNYAQLGDNTTTNKSSPTRVGTDSDWAKVSSGLAYHTCGIKTGGSLWCWGYNTSGQLGDGTTTQRKIPVRIGADTDWSEVALGNTSTCALKTNGTLWCWGANSYGQLGIGSKTTQKSPVQVGTGTNWTSLSVGQYQVCARRSDNTLWCWGNDTTYGQLGVGSITVSIPATVQ